MFFKNIQLALRNLLRDKFYTVINISGLAVGMTAALLLFIWVNNERSYDNFHSKKDRLYRINANMSFGGERLKSIKSPFPLSEAAAKAIPEIESISTDFEAWELVYQVDELLLESEHTHFVYPDFLNLFDFDFVTGDPKTVLDNPNSVVFTESFAQQLFGTIDVLGRSVVIKDSITLNVTGIIKDFPNNSVLKFEALAPIQKNIERLVNEGSRKWGSNNFNTFTLLQPSANIKNIENKLTALLPKNAEEAPSERTHFELQAVKNIYLGSADLNTGNQPLGDIKTIRLFTLIGLLILLIACINYINLATARAAHRAKSVGIQKVIGASRFQLFKQHFTEAALVVGLSAILSLVLADFGLPIFENLLGTDLPKKTVISFQTIPIILFTFLGTVLLSGIQPAMYLTAFKPIETLKGGQLNNIKGKVGLRKILVISQFTCSTILIICTLIMMQQMDFVRHSKLGYEKEHIFSFWQNPKKAGLINTELSTQPGIIEVTSSNRKIADINSRYGGFTYEGMPEGSDPSIYNVAVDSKYQEFFGLSLKAGRWFRPDGKDTKSLIINEKAAKIFQMDNPIGKWVDFWGRRGTIVGVVKDFHFRSFHHEIQPLIFEQNPNWYNNTYIKTTGKNAAQAIASAEKVYKKHHPNSVFKYNFLDETYNNLYKTESRMSQLFSVFALLTIFISCLGILGLATYIAERRGKEVGIRKVLGASVLNIINLLSFDFLKLVLIAIVIAIPFAWFFMKTWLQTFAFSINIGWGAFAITILTTLFMAYSTIGFQSLRAALANPAETLKTE